MFKDCLIINENMKFAGVYVILNTSNNKFYIGSTVNVYKRKNEHFYNLENNVHKNIHLQRSFNKYKMKNFVGLLLEKVNNLNDLKNKEQYWLDILYDKNKSYNILTKAYNSLGFKHSEETKNKISEMQKGEKNNLYGKQHKEETKIKMSNAHIGNKNPMFGKTHSSSVRKKISEGNKNKTVIWSEQAKEKLSNSLKLKRNEIIKRVSKPVLQFDLEGNLIKEWESGKVASEILNCSKQHISACCLGKRKTHKGFIWKFKNEGGE